MPTQVPFAPFVFTFLPRQAAEPPLSPGSLLYALNCFNMSDYMSDEHVLGTPGAPPCRATCPALKPRQAAEPPLSPGSLLYVLYVLYLTRQAAEPPLSPGSLLYVLYVLYLTRQAAEPPLSPGSLLYVLYVLYLTRQAAEPPLSPGPCYMCYMCYILHAKPLNPHSPPGPCFMCYMCYILPATPARHWSPAEPAARDSQEKNSRIASFNPVVTPGLPPSILQHYAPRLAARIARKTTEAHCCIAGRSRKTPAAMP